MADTTTPDQEAASAAMDLEEIRRLVESQEPMNIQTFIRKVMASNAIKKMKHDLSLEWESLLWDVVHRYVPMRDWADLNTPYARTLYLNAETWSPPKLFDSPAVQLADKDFFTRAPVPCPDPTKLSDKTFFYANQLLPETASLPTISPSGGRGRVFFSGDVVIPTLFEVTPEGGLTVWMSHTPMECFTQRAGVRMARGRVVVGGLGLGWLLTKVCQRPSVREVIVVEKDAALLAWVREALCAKHPEVANRVKAWLPYDVYDYLDDHGLREAEADTVYLLDIWPGYRDCEDDGRFQEWRQRLPRSRLWGWGQKNK